jgi:kynurenine formamidase
MSLDRAYTSRRMCAPSVVTTVREELSRRHFLGALGGAVAALSVGGSAQTPGKPLRLSRGFRDTFDLTHTLSSQTPVYPVFRPMQYVEKFTIAKDGFGCGELTFNEHTGTHMDAPIHFVAGKTSVDRLPVDKFFAPLAVVSIKERVDKDPDTAVSVDDILAWERRHGRLPAGAFVAMYSGWDLRIGDPRTFLNADANNTMHTPGFGGEAAKFLTEQRDIVGVGVDTLSLDLGTSTAPVAHLAVLGAGKYGVEVIANLAAVPPAGATIIVGAPKHLGGTGGPVRLFAVA